MALVTKFVGSGHFAPERDWSCPVHDDDVSHSDDCDPWQIEGEICLDCETGHWIDRKDSDGNVVMYEIGAWEWMLLEQAKSFFDDPSPLLHEMLAVKKLGSGRKIEWLEDDLRPNGSG